MIFKLSDKFLGFFRFVFSPFDGEDDDNFRFLFDNFLMTGLDPEEWVNSFDLIFFFFARPLVSFFRDPFDSCTRSFFLIFLTFAILESEWNGRKNEERLANMKLLLT